MKDRILGRCDLLAKNRDVISKCFKWESDYMTLSAATIFASNGVIADPDKLKEVEKIFKSRNGFWSDFGGHIRIPLICKMSLSDEPLKYFEKVEEIYKVMNARKIFGSEYRIMAAMTIYDHVGDGDFEKYIERTDEIYRGMSKNHAILTGCEDIPFAAMLAVSDIGVDRLLDDMEASYAILKKKFHDYDAVQSLSHVLALQSGNPEEKCSKVISLFDSLKAAKHKYGTGYELPTLATLTLLDMPEAEIVDLIAEADDHLKTQKGFGNFILGGETRRLFASQMLLAEAGSATGLSESAVMSSMLAITVAIEVCLMLCAVNAATVAASSTN